MARPAPPARTRSYGRCRRVCRGRSEPSGLSWQAPLLDIWHGEPQPANMTSECGTRIKRSRVTVIGSTGHVLELHEFKRLRPFKTALGEHLKHRFNAHRVVQAADGDEDHPRKALQVGAEHPGAAIGAEVSI